MRRISFEYINLFKILFCFLFVGLEEIGDSDFDMEITDGEGCFDDCVRHNRLMYLGSDIRFLDTLYEIVFGNLGDYLFFRDN